MQFGNKSFVRYFIKSLFKITTLCLKKRPTFQLSLTLSNLNRFSKFLHCWKTYEFCYKSHMTIPTLPQACCYTTAIKHLLVFVTAKSGWNRSSGFDNMPVLTFCEFGLKTPIHAPFWVFDPPRWDMFRNYKFIKFYLNSRKTIKLFFVRNTIVNPQKRQQVF